MTAYTETIKALKEVIKKHYRWIIILVTAIFEIVFIIKYSDTLDILLVKEWTKPIITIVFAAPVAFWLWLFKNHDKKKDLIQKDKDLPHHERDLVLKEKNDLWDNLVKFQDIVDDKNTSVAKKTTAILGLGEFYNHKFLKYLRQVHTIFKIYLKEFWSEKKIINQYEFLEHPEYITNIPEYIKAIYEIIRKQSFKMRNDKNLFHRDNGFLDFSDFCLQGANLSEINLAYTDLRRVDFSAANLSYANMRSAYCENVVFPIKMINVKLEHSKIINASLINAHLGKANLASAYLNNVDLSCADLGGAKLTNAELIDSNLSNVRLVMADLIGAKLMHTKNLTNAILKGAKYCKEAGFITQFPKGFNPETYGMQLVDKDGNPVEG